MILKDITTPNGPAQYHVIKKFECLPPFSLVSIFVDSYTSEAVYQANGGFYRNILSMPQLSITGQILDSIEAWLIVSPDSIFQNGTLTVDTTETLENAKDRCWTKAKQNRSLAESQPFTYDGDLFDSNKEQVMGAVQLAVISQLAGQPFSINWTLYNNTVKTYNATQMIAIGVELGKMVSGVYDTARTLREQIDAATVVTELDSINWPVSIQPLVPTAVPTPIAA